MHQPPSSLEMMQKMDQGDPAPAITRRTTGPRFAKVGMKYKQHIPFWDIFILLLPNANAQKHPQSASGGFTEPSFKFARLEAAPHPNPTWQMS
jgi:hypothetical protein